MKLGISGVAVLSIVVVACVNRPQACFSVWEKHTDQSQRYCYLDRSDCEHDQRIVAKHRLFEYSAITECIWQ